jgi:acetyltransferase-like isoleucine patch superfamily enzyme
MRDLLRFVEALPRSLFAALVVYLPGEAGILLRRWYYGRRLGRCGRNLVVMPGVHFGGAPFIEIGDDVTIREHVVMHAGMPPGDDRREIVRIGNYNGRRRGVIEIGDHARIAFGAVVLGYGGVTIGEKCGVGPYSLLLSETFHHKGKDPCRIYKYSQGAQPHEQCVLQGFIEMMDGSGVASGVLVLPGARIASNAWVAPNSVVRIGGHVEPDVIAKGDPAGVVFRRRYAAPPAEARGDGSCA